MIPFGETILMWRLYRGYTQETLARAAHIPRPNLSSIERGGREVSLKTLRALALALGVRPGILADGQAPSVAKPARLSRRWLERVADGLALGRMPSDPREKALVGQLRPLVASRLPQPGRRIGRQAERAWLALSAHYPPEVVESLLQRVRERMRP